MIISFKKKKRHSKISIKCYNEHLVSICVLIK